MYKQHQNYFQERYMYGRFYIKSITQKPDHLQFCSNLCQFTPRRETPVPIFFRRIGQIFFNFWSRHVIFVRFDLLNFTITSDVLFTRKVSVNKLVLSQLCPSAGYLDYKKYHDIQICTRPTCRGILCDGIRNFFFQTQVFFSNLQMSIYTFF